ncbi:MAG: septal ring lytic transglycosylase RlpA family protein [Gallionellaceae bacterium]|nr:septal ring lytic transglycosylase RlpA family protein [Gallionellaceae bacterium]
MSKQTGLILFATAILAACGSAPERTAETRGSPVPVVESQPIRIEPAAQPARGSAPESKAEARRPAPVVESQSIQLQPAAKPGSGGYLAGDGPGADAPANLDATPDAVPKAEPLHNYANRQYAALGKTYTPLAAPGNYKERGIASWYGKKFHGQRTSSGEVYDMYGMTAAHPVLPIPSYARVTNAATNKSVVVRVNDRGPFLHERIIDLSYTAAYKLGIVGNGSSEVIVESLTPDTTIPAPIVAEPIKVEPLPPEPVKAAAPADSNRPVIAAAGGNVFLQLGAFKSHQGAEGFLARMRAEFEGSGKQVNLYEKDGLARVHVGPYANQNEARASAEKLQARLGFRPIVSLH